MPTRDERRAEAAKHLALMNAAFAAETRATVDALTIYEDGEGRELELPEPAFETTKTAVTTRFASAEVHRAQGKVVVVDPASFTRPGGAYEDGSFGPEQALCAESNLYPILRGIKADYHDANRDYQSGQLFTDRAAYLPDVVFVREGATKRADVLAIAEPNRQRALENHRSERECDVCRARRIEALLRIAAVNGAETLIVGAFGCGRDAEGDEQVVELFRQWIDAHPGAIGTIVFAVPRAHFDAFDAAFGATDEAAAPEPTVAADEEDEEDFRSIELPEGVTLRA